MRKPVHKSGQYEDQNYNPERELWFAVIERAIKDYSSFFEKTLTTSKGTLGNYHFIAPRKSDNFCLKAIYELERLRWFIFSTEKEEFNLEYLAEQLYEDGRGVIAKIRKEAHRQFMACLEKSKDRESLAQLISHIYENMPELVKKD